jgi:hypothetical protein
VKKAQASQSPWAIAKRRFFRNLPATLSLGYLLLNALLAIFAYAIIPDSTHNANSQLVQMPKQPPGTTVTVLLQPLHPAPPQPGFFQRLLSGSADAHLPLPIQSLQSPGTDSLVLRYKDLRGKEQQLDIAEFLLPMQKTSAFALAAKAETGHPYRLEAGGKYVMRTLWMGSMWYPPTVSPRHSTKTTCSNGISSWAPTARAGMCSAACSWVRA